VCNRLFDSRISTVENLDYFRVIHEFSVLAFSRTKGHGFLKGSDGDSIFFHVSDVNGEVLFQYQNFPFY